MGMGGWQKKDKIYWLGKKSQGRLYKQTNIEQWSKTIKRKPNLIDITGVLRTILISTIYLHPPVKNDLNFH